jgi:hypothetical protein
MGGFTGLRPLGTLNVALSNFAKEFRNGDFVGDIVAPRVPVDRQGFQYIIFDRSNMRNDRQTLRAPGAKPQSIRMSYTDDTYFCKSRALDAEVPYESEAYAMGAGFSLKQKATKRVVDKLNLDREIQIANLVNNTTNFPNFTDLASTHKWDDYVNSHPIVDVDAAKAVIRQAGVKPSYFVISDPVFVALRNHPDIIDRFKYTTPGSIGVAELSTVFGVPVTVASGVVLDVTDAGSWIWGVTAFLGYSEPTAAMDDVSAAKTFVWTGAPDSVDGYGVMEWPDPHRSSKKDWVSADWYWDIKATAQETGYLFQNACAVPTFGSIPAPVEG